METASLKYYIWFLTKTIGGLFRRHSFAIKNKSDFEVSKELCFLRDIKGWDEFLKSEFNFPKASRLSFTFAWRWQVIQFFRVMDALGFNYKNVLHVSSHLRFKYVDLQIFGESKLTFHSQVNSISRRSRSKVSLEFMHSVSSDKYGAIYECSDEVTILGFKETFLDELEKVGGILPANSGSLERLSEPLQSAKKDVHVIQNRFAMNENVGVRFGKVSGDLNPLHTNSFLARILGHKKAFAQGMLIVNVVSNYLFQYAQKGELFFRFVKPMYLGQEYCLNIYDGSFAVLSLDNLIVCDGKFK